MEDVCGGLLCTDWPFEFSGSVEVVVREYDPLRYWEVGSIGFAAKNLLRIYK